MASRPSSPTSCGSGASRHSSGGNPTTRRTSGSSLYAGYQNIIKGKHDTYIRDWAKAAKAFGRPVVVRFAHEMNGNWFPWSIGNHGNTPGSFVKAWRHVVNEVRAVGARNVKFLWSPYNAESGGYAPFYPGNAYVDYVGVTSLNWGNERWRWLPDLLSRPMSVLRNVSRTSGNPLGKPVILPEVGSNHLGGAKADWIRSGYTQVYKTMADRPCHGVSRLQHGGHHGGAARLAPGHARGWFGAARLPIRGGLAHLPGLVPLELGRDPRDRPRRPAVPRARRRRMGHPFHTSVMLA